MEYTFGGNLPRAISELWHLHAYDVQLYLLVHHSFYKDDLLKTPANNNFLSFMRIELNKPCILPSSGFCLGRGPLG